MLQHCTTPVISSRKHNHIRSINSLSALSQRLRQCVEYDKSHISQRFSGVFAATVTPQEAVMNVKNVGKKTQLLPFWRRNQLSSDARRGISHRVLNWKHTDKATTPEFPINKIIKFRNASHQKDRWLESWNIKKCQWVGIKCFSTRAVTRSGSELLQYDSGDTTHS